MRSPLRQFASWPQGLIVIAALVTTLGTVWFRHGLEVLGRAVGGLLVFSVLIGIGAMATGLLVQYARETPEEVATFTQTHGIHPLLFQGIVVAVVWGFIGHLFWEFINSF